MGWLILCVSIVVIYTFLLANTYIMKAESDISELESLDSGDEELL
ncbi:hypothetical protein F373_gp083 [Bacillus phage SP-10]|nr:hypothetical protein F373_gp083 [Bacillus phage SP-10]BAK52895.1 hypothetical protein [Bacillus phage SP-10]